MQQRKKFLFVGNFGKTFSDEQAAHCGFGGNVVCMENKMVVAFKNRGGKGRCEKTPICPVHCVQSS